MQRFFLSPEIYRKSVMKERRNKGVIIRVSW